MKSKRPLRPSFVLVTSVAFGCGGQLSEGNPTSSESDRQNQVTDSQVDTSAHNDSVCPVEAPVAGADCVPGAPSSCSYNNSYNKETSCPREFHCEAATHTWSDVSMSCNPPPVQCPALPPTFGSACSGVGLCAYESYGICGNTILTYRCSGQTWSQDSIPEDGEPHAVCPAVAPKNGDACTGCYLEPCSYCGAQATCDANTKKWIVQESSCSPPPLVDAGTL